MKLRNLIPVLDVHDVETSIEFYTEALGFRLHDKLEWGGKTEWALLRNDHVELMLCASSDHEIEEATRPGEGVFFLYLDNVESLLVYLGSKGYADRLDGLQPIQPGRDFFLRDPDGYVLWFSHRPVGADGAAEVMVEPPRQAAGD
jgi:catechol 2,3-dioxygenase-like lactoylglutathione lyase family enzyme